MKAIWFISEREKRRERPKGRGRQQDERELAWHREKGE